MSMEENVLKELVPKLADALEVAQSADHNTKAKQATYQVVTNFRDNLTQAKQNMLTLPGGELLIEEQHVIIDMLEGLRESKRSQLIYFSKKALTSKNESFHPAFRDIEVDSTASSPREKL